MAEGRPWYKRNGGEFILGTVHMDLETRGAYSVLIDLLNDRDRPIPDEPRFIAGILNCSVRKWGEVRKRLLAEGKLILDDNGCLTNARFERERAARHLTREQAVEAGRRGGLKSAEKRASQPELPLDENDELGDYRPDKSTKKAARVKDKLAHEETGGNVSNDLGQATPQASRARESPETRVLHTNDLESRTSPGARSEPPGRLDQTDLIALMEAATEAAGFNPSQPAVINRELQLVQAWRDAGIDFTTVVVPTIRAEVAKSHDPTSSLKRFDRAVRHQAARLKATNGSGATYRPPGSPVLEPPGEDPAFRPLRQALLERCGPHAYCLAYNDVRFENVDEGGQVLRVNGPETRIEAVALGPYAGTTRKAASALGFKAVWKGR